MARYISIWSRTLTGAWIETGLCGCAIGPQMCRTLTGAWIETTSSHISPAVKPVAPSRVRGLKPGCGPDTCSGQRVAPSRVRGLKQIQKNHINPLSISRTLTGAWIETMISLREFLPGICRTLTGAWIETPADAFCLRYVVVAPSRVRGLKPRYIGGRLAGK